ncbi:MAG: hypothetical protein JST39_17800 [Bacteroidetes bacterium]|nr:hypothetical protein [Bacteroidota bacterium]
MYYTLLAAIACAFVAHLALMLLSFSGGRFHPRRYFYSHLTLWMTGLFLFAAVWLYEGEKLSAFLDYFDTTTSKLMVLVATVGVSLLAHIIVRKLVLPAMYRKRANG